MSAQSAEESTSSPGAVLAAAEAASGSQRLTVSSSSRELKRNHSDESAQSSAKRTPSAGSRGSAGQLPPALPVAHSTGSDRQDGYNDDSPLADLLNAERSQSAAVTPRRPASPAASSGGHWSMQVPGPVNTAEGQAESASRGAHGSPAGGSDPGTSRGARGSSAGGSDRGTSRGPYGRPTQGQGIIRASPNTSVIGAEGGIMRPAHRTVAAAAEGGPP